MSKNILILIISALVFSIIYMAFMKHKKKKNEKVRVVLNYTNYFILSLLYISLTMLFFPILIAIISDLNIKLDKALQFCLASSIIYIVLKIISHLVSRFIDKAKLPDNKLSGRFILYFWAKHSSKIFMISYYLITAMFYFGFYSTKDSSFKDITTMFSFFFIFTKIIDEFEKILTD